MPPVKSVKPSDEGTQVISKFPFASAGLSVSPDQNECYVVMNGNRAEVAACGSSVNGGLVIGWKIPMGCLRLWSVSTVYGLTMSTEDRAENSEVEYSRRVYSKIIEYRIESESLGINFEMCRY